MRIHRHSHWKFYHDGSFSISSSLIVTFLLWPVAYQTSLLTSCPQTGQLLFLSSVQTDCEKFPVLEATLFQQEQRGNSFCDNQFYLQALKSLVVTTTVCVFKGNHTELGSVAQLQFQDPFMMIVYSNSWISALLCLPLQITRRLPSIRRLPWTWFILRLPITLLHMQLLWIRYNKESDWISFLC